MTGPSTPFSGAAPIRMIVRGSNEMIWSRGLRWQAVTATDPIECLLLQVILSANIAQDRRGFETPDADRRAISVMAIADSMGLPYTTMRRRAGAIMRRGWIAPHDGGLIVPQARLAEPDGVAMLSADAQEARALIATIATTGHPSAVTAAARFDAMPDLAVAHLMLEYIVRAMQGFMRLYDGYATGMICAGLTALNVRHLTEDPALNLRYATSDQVPGDEERRAVTMRALSRQLDLPFETVRRHMQTLQDRALVVPKGDGWIVPTRVITSDAHHRYNLFMAAQFDRMLASAPPAWV